MTRNNLKEVEQKEKAMIEIAYDILNEKVDTPREYHSLLKEASNIRGITEEERKERVGHLYTEMTLDGRFVNLGDNQWGLRSWYPFEQTPEELSQTNKPVKKDITVDEDDDVVFQDEDEFDEFENLEDELDELANEEDDVLDEVEDEEIDEEFEEDLDEPIDEDEEEPL